MASVSWIWKETAEVLAVLGVIGSLVFVAFEIQQNTVAVRAETSLGIQAQLHAIYEMLMTDPMMEIYMQGMESPGDLDAIERAKLRTFLSLNLSAFQNLHFQVREGSYDEASARGYWQVLRNMMEYPGMKEYWATRSIISSDAFRAFVETDVMALPPGEGTPVLGGQE